MVAESPSDDVTLEKSVETGVQVEIKSKFRKTEKATFLHNRNYVLRKLYHQNTPSQIHQVAACDEGIHDGEFPPSLF